MIYALGVGAGGTKLPGLDQPVLGRSEVELGNLHAMTFGIKSVEGGKLPQRLTRWSHVLAAREFSAGCTLAAAFALCLVCPACIALGLGNAVHHGFEGYARLRQR